MTASADAVEVANTTNPLDSASRFRIFSLGPTIEGDPSSFPAVELSITIFPGLTENLNVTLGAQGDFFRTRRD